MSAFTTFLDKNSLSFDKGSSLVYGKLAGYPLVLPLSQKAVIGELVFSLARQGQEMTDEEAKRLKESTAAIAKVTIIGYLVRVTPKGGMTANKRFEQVQQALNASLAFFQQEGFQPVCQLTGTEEARLYLVGSGAQFLSQQGLEQQRSTFLVKETDELNTQEQVVPGIVGAFLGSLVGVVVSVIIGQLGYVAALSGIVMGVATLKGYKFLGKRLSRKGIIISALIMLAMTYFAFHLDWAFAIARLAEIDVFTAFQAIPYLLETGDLDQTQYMIGLFSLYLFTLLGAVPTVLSALKEQKNQYQIRQLS